ncbi:MAG: pre-16S rRNA-processing nuclease YqgF [Acholeplasmataceae bacterium]|nr:pre-16S rRNA-processing nuclease YqgF [Acholeplasmataceae bacterium]
MNSKELILGVDPGSSKTGVALVTAGGEIKNTEVLLMADFTGALEEFLGQQEVSLCVMGNGTTAAAMKAALHELLPSVEIVLIDEAHSTEEARVLYWQLNPPKGLRKLFPLGMQVPPVNLDGLAAVVLVRRYLKKID